MLFQAMLQQTPNATLASVQFNLSEQLFNLGYSATWRGLVSLYSATLSTNIAPTTRAQYAKNLKQFFIWLERTGRQLDKLTDLDITAFLYDLEEKGLSPLTITAYLNSVKLFYAWIAGKKLYPNIAEIVKAPRRAQEHTKKHIAKDKAQDMLKHLASKNTKRDYALVKLMFNTGIRTIEAARANIQDIKLEPYTDSETGETQYRRVLYIQGKGHRAKDRIVNIHESVYNTIKEYLDTERKGAKGGEPLFTSYSNHHGKGQALTTRSISRICKEALKEIGLEDRAFSAHSIRHTTAVTLLRLKHSLEEVKDVLGHTSTDTTRIYIHDIEKEQHLEKAPEFALASIFA